MKKIFVILFCLSFCCINAQSYKASYIGTYILPGQSFSFSVDSSAKKHLDNIDSNWNSSIKNHLLTKISWIVEINSDGNITHLKSVHNEGSPLFKINYTNMNLKRIGDNFYVDDKLEDNKPVQPISNEYYIPTGDKKKILSYDCFKAVNKKGDQVIWYCKELPLSLSPGVLSNFNMAILEWQSTETHYILNSLELFFPDESPATRNCNN